MKNGSFERNTPTHDNFLYFNVFKWGHCGFEGNSPPTLQQNDNLYYEAETRTPFGEFYLNLVARPDNTWEGINLKLKKPLKAGQTYYLAFYACLSMHMKSIVVIDGKRSTDPVSFGRPLQLTIYGGNKRCRKQVMIGTTPPIRNVLWKEYVIEIQPKEDIKYLNFESIYDSKAMTAYAGNICLDYFYDIYIKEEE